MFRRLYLRWNKGRVSWWYGMYVFFMVKICRILKEIWKISMKSKLNSLEKWCVFVIVFCIIIEMVIFF